MLIRTNSPDMVLASALARALRFSVSRAVLLSILESWMCAFMVETTRVVRRRSKLRMMMGVFPYSYPPPRRQQFLQGAELPN